MATVSRLSNTGIMYTSGEIDEVTNNLAAQGSILFNGTTQYLTTPANTALAFGTGNFTVEMWLYPTSNPSIVYLWGQINSADYAPVLGNIFSGVVGMAASAATGSWVINAQASGAPALGINKWTHVAYVRYGNRFSVYLNGIEYVVAASTAVTPFISTDVFAIGGEGVAPLNYPFPGYISNFRVVKGIAVYTGAFTAPSQPLKTTQLAGTNIAAITNSANTSLLSSTLYNNAFKDLSDNNLPITPVASPTSTVQHPFNPNIYTSVLFNGSSSYITAPYNVNQTLGTNNFTIEAWIYPKAVGSQQWILSSWYGLGGQIIFYYNSSNRLTFHYVTTGNVQVDLIGTSTVIVANVWQHVAVVRNGATITLYVNGIADATTSNVGAGTALIYYGLTPKDMIVGRDQGASSNYFNGYMYNLRLVNGTAVYTSDFYPPTVPLTNITNTQLLLFLSKTSALVDNSSYNSGSALTLTNTASLFPGQSMSTNPIPISYANTGLAVSKQYSNGALQTVGQLDEVSLSTSIVGSISLNGSSQYLNYISTALISNSGDFTLECYAYFNSVSGPTILYCMPSGTAGLGEFNIWVNVGRIRVIYDGGTTFFDATSTISTGVWYHIALVRSGSGAGNIVLYINGVASGSATGTALFGKNNATITIGSQTGGAAYMNGYMSQIRFVRGIAVYTGEFTTPTLRLETIQNSSANIVTITNAASVPLMLNTYKTSFEDGSIYTKYNTIISVGLPPSSNLTPFAAPSLANTTLRKQYSNGTIQIINKFDEYTSIA